MKQNEGNGENKGGNPRNGMGIRVRRISVGIRRTWLKMQKKREIRVVMQGIEVETKV